MTEDNGIGALPPPTRRLWSRLAGFGAVPMLSLFTPVLALPVLARVLSIDQWASVAIGQSVGTLGAILVAFGWPVVGPAESARSAESTRRLLIGESVASRGLVAVFAVPASMVGAAALSAPTTHLLAAGSAVATLSGGVSFGWYAIGIGRPGILAVYEAGPRALGNLGGAALVALTGWVYAFPLALTLVSLAGATAFLLRHAVRLPRPVMSTAVARIRRNAFAAATEITAGAYSFGAAALVAVVGTSVAVSHFNAGERIARLGSVVIIVVGSALQGWVAEASGRTFQVRARRALLLHTAVGMTGFAVLALGGPTLTRLFFGPELAISRTTGVGFGWFFLVWSLETVTSRHILATRGRTKVLFVTTAIGSAFGVVAILAAAAHADEAGAALALAGTMTAILLMQVRPSWAAVRSEVERDVVVRSINSPN